MDIPRNYHLEDKVEYIIALVNEERMIRLSGVKESRSGSRDCETERNCRRRYSTRGDLQAYFSSEDQDRPSPCV